jgi:hypothetical protein
LGKLANICPACPLLLLLHTGCVSPVTKHKLLWTAITACALHETLVQQQLPGIAAGTNTWPVQQQQSLVLQMAAKVHQRQHHPLRLR